MKKNCMFIKKIFIITTTLTCLFSCGCNTSEEGSQMKSIHFQEKILPIGPVEEFTIENGIKSVTQNLASVTDSYGQMISLAESENASSAGKDAANNVTEKYAARIEEIKSIDFSTLSLEDLSSLSSELSHIITAIREARDLLNT